MSEIYSRTLLEQGSEIIEQSIGAQYDTVSETVASLVEPCIVDLEYDPVDAFSTLARTILQGIDRPKSFRSQSLQVARRTIAVSQLVVSVALERKVVLDCGSVINAYIDSEKPEDAQFTRFYNGLQGAFGTSLYFSRIMKNCHENIDPTAKEPDLFQIFAGFSLLAMAAGEGTLARQELEQAAVTAASFDGDLWEEFDR